MKAMLSGITGVTLAHLLELLVPKVTLSHYLEPVVLGGPCHVVLSCASSTRLGKTFTRHFATHRWDQSTH